MKTATVRRALQPALCSPQRNTDAQPGKRGPAYKLTTRLHQKFAYRSIFRIQLPPFPFPPHDSRHPFAKLQSQRQEGRGREIHTHMCVYIYVCSKLSSSSFPRENENRVPILAYIISYQITVYVYAVVNSDKSIFFFIRRN